jgi:integrase
MNKGYVIRRRGIYYFQRRVPKKLRHLYESDVISVSLKTTNAHEANKLARELARQLEVNWLHLNFNEKYIKNLTRDGGMGAPSYIPNATSRSLNKAPRLLEVKEAYINSSGKNRTPAFYESVNRSYALIMDIKGNAEISNITRADVNGLRDKLIDKGLSPQTIRRLMVPLRASFALVISEQDLHIKNVFGSLRLPNSQQVRKRGVFDADLLMEIQSRCKFENNEQTQLLLLISDSGMRLAEAVGLLIADIKLDGEVPHVNLIPHPWRRLKNSNSARLIPLVGSSLWAAKEIIASKQEDQIFAFPRYCNDKKCNTHNASSRLLYWLRKYVNDESLVVHSFRHTMRDRLRAIECPVDMVDQIGGWATKNIGAQYGHGYPLANLNEWMRKMIASK